MSERLILFARTPGPGRAKSRLRSALGDGATDALYRALLLDSLALVTRLARDRRVVEVSFDRPWTPDGPFQPACAALEVTFQCDGDLGRRLRYASDRARAAGAIAIAFVGADAPTLADAVVDAAFSALAGGADAVVTPSNDGGYVLIGTRGPIAPLVEEIPWGTPGVLDATRARAARAGARLDEIGCGFDVDEPRDLVTLAEAMRDPAARRRAPCTAAWLSARPG